MDISSLPSRKGLEKNIPLEHAEILGIHPCGDSDNGLGIYKMLTMEGVMITYTNEDGILHYVRSDPIRKVAWKT